MSPEEKQALIEWCEWRIARGSQSTMSEQTLKAAKITLAALTAQPIVLPHHVTHVTNKHYEEGRDDVIDAIRAAGYEVQE